MIVTEPSLRWDRPVQTVQETKNLIPVICKLSVLPAPTKLKALPLKVAWWHRGVFSEVVFITFSEERIPKCQICDSTLEDLTWTICHGIAECICGAEYRVLHYSKEVRGSLLIKEPECLVPAELIPKYKEIWAKNHLVADNLRWSRTTLEEDNLNRYFRQAKSISKEYNKSHKEEQE